MINDSVNKIIEALEASEERFDKVKSFLLKMG